MPHQSKLNQKPQAKKDQARPYTDCFKGIAPMVKPKVEATKISISLEAFREEQRLKDAEFLAKRKSSSL